jgi:hypothetical protein
VALTLLQYEHLVRLLGDVPALVDALEDRRPGFTTDVVDWLRQVEEALADDRLPAVSQVAACRAQLIEARRGVLPAGVVVMGRPTARKVQEAAAARVLERSSDILHGVIADREGVFAEAERVSAQLVVVGGAKGLVAACHDGNSHPEMLRCLQRSLAADGDLAGGYAHLLSLVGSTDVIIVLDRALARLS